MIPSVVYCEPPLGSFGLTEEEAAKRGLNAESASFPYAGLGKAVAAGNPDGMIKIVHNPVNGGILGDHVVGQRASEIVHELLLAKQAELVLSDVAEMIHAHPALSEGVMEAARAALGRAVHS